jgi:hypothetical protein
MDGANTARSSQLATVLNATLNQSGELLILA